MRTASKKDEDVAMDISFGCVGKLSIPQKYGHSKREHEDPLVFSVPHDQTSPEKPTIAAEHGRFGAFHILS